MSMIKLRGKCLQHDALIAKLEALGDFAGLYENLPGLSFTFEMHETGLQYTLHYKSFNHRLPCILDYSPSELEQMGANFLTKVLCPEDSGFAEDMIASLSSGCAANDYAALIRLKPRVGDPVSMFLICSVSQRFGSGRPKQIKGIGLLVEDERIIREKLHAGLSGVIPPEVLDMIKELTKRQKEVLVLALKGLAAKEIADKLFISLNTVNSHIKAIRQIFHLTFNGSLLQFAIDNGLFFWLKSQQ